VIALYLVLKCYVLAPADSDENIYFYMSVRTAFGGLWPYRDYFFAHPPLHLMISVLFLKVAALFHGVPALTAPQSWAEGGLAVQVMKSIGIVSGAVTGVFVFRAARQAAGPLEGVIAAAALLLAIDVVYSFFTGTIEALMFTAIGVERVVAGRDRQAGLAFAAGCLVAMYVAPFGLAVWLVLLALSRRRALTLALWTAAPLLLVHGAFLAWAGRAYWEGVFLYHARKPHTSRGAFVPGFLLLLRRSALLVTAAPAAVVAAFIRARRAGWRQALASLRSLDELRADPRRQLLAFSLAGVVATLLFIAAGRMVFRYYFVMILVGLALLAGLAYADLARAALTAARGLWRRRSLRLEGLTPAVALLAALPLAGEALADLPAARRTLIPDVAVGQRAPRTWRRAPFLGPFNGAVRALLWQDEEVLGRWYPPWTRILWEASQRIELVVFARFAYASTPPDATLFGESTMVPLVALMAARRVALDEADTNPMRFQSGITPPAAFVARLREHPPALILFPAGALMSMDTPFQDWMFGSFDSSLVSDRGHNLYYVMRPKGSPPLPERPP
jgi:hypothetical protein